VHDILLPPLDLVTYLIVVIGRVLIIKKYISTLSRAARLGEGRYKTIQFIEKS
jgi:hypothetical protein